MTKRDRNGGSNIVELLGLLVAAVGLFVTLSDKLHTGRSGARPSIERQETPGNSRPNYRDGRSFPRLDMPKSYKRQDRLTPSKANDRLPRR